MKKLLFPIIMACCLGSAMAQNDQAGTDLKYYNMSFSLDPDDDKISAENRIHFATTSQNDKPIVLELNNMYGITEISLLSNPKRKKLQYEHSDNKITIYPDGQWGDTDSISVIYSTIEYNTESEGLVYTTHQNVKSIWTLSCPYAASDWFVCKQDNTDKIDSVTITTTCPDKYRTAANGLIIKDVTKDGKRTTVWHHRHPIDYYLICMACTNYEVYSDFVELDDGSQVEILNMVYPEYLDRARKLSKELIPIFQLYCRLFGKYPFANEKYGQAQFGWGGGMEHQTMTFVSDFDVNLTAHELSHQWFGDNITCNSWNEVWLNESFATYCEYLAVEQGLMHSTKTQWLYKTNGFATIEESGKIYVDDASDFAGIFNYNTSYCKGALVLHNLRMEIGDEAFFKALKSYATDPSLMRNTARGADFIKHVNEASGRDMNWFFDQWIYGSGYPVFAVEWASDSKTLKLRVNQKASDNGGQFFRTKLPVMLCGEGSQNETVILDITQQNQKISLKTQFDVKSITIDPRHETVTKQPVVIKVKKI